MLKANKDFLVFHSQKEIIFSFLRRFRTADLEHLDSVTVSFSPYFALVPDAR